MNVVPIPGSYSLSVLERLLPSATTPAADEEARIYPGSTGAYLAELIRTTTLPSGPSTVHVPGARWPGPQMWQGAYAVYARAADVLAWEVELARLSCDPSALEKALRAGEARYAVLCALRMRVETPIHDIRRLELAAGENHITPLERKILALARILRDQGTYHLEAQLRELRSVGWEATPMRGAGLCARVAGWVAARPTHLCPDDITVGDVRRWYARAAPGWDCAGELVLDSALNAPVGEPTHSARREFLPWMAVGPATFLGCPRTPYGRYIAEVVSAWWNPLSDWVFMNRATQAVSLLSASDIENLCWEGDKPLPDPRRVYLRGLFHKEKK